MVEIVSFKNGSFANFFFFWVLTVNETYQLWLDLDESLESVEMLEIKTAEFLLFSKKKPKKPPKNKCSKDLKSFIILWPKLVAPTYPNDILLCLYIILPSHYSQYKLYLSFVPEVFAWQQSFFSKFSKVQLGQNRFWFSADDIFRHFRLRLIHVTASISNYYLYVSAWI